MEKYNPINPDENFVRWILSICKNWRDRGQFQPFLDYVKQCEDWLKQGVKVSDYTEHSSEWEQAIKGERERVATNSLYYMRKYNYFVDAKEQGGKRKTTTCDSQDVMCFLLDYGCSMLIAKARGIRSTSTFLPIAGIKAARIKNISIQYICSNESKAKRLFSEKVKVTAQNDPLWLQPSIGKDTEKSREYFRKTSKGERVGMLSKLFIDAPSKDVVNAINPDIVMIDEAPSISIFSTMMQEARPALFSERDGVRTQAKQIIAWGSSQVDEGDNVQVSNDFENEWKALYEAYQKGDYSAGIVPIFFDCWAIPSLTQEQYDREYKIAASKKRESDIIRNRKHYPTCPDDVFLKNVNTLIPFEDIQGQLEKIYLFIKNKDIALYRGYFQPVYDKNHPLPPEIGSPYRIINAEFIPVSDTQMNDATVTIFSHPKKDWIYRYYQGTDPVVGVSGHSKFASAIFDNCNEKDAGKTLSAVLNSRHTNYKKDYEQSYCMHLYYSNIPQKHFIPELLEINLGNEYNSYCEIMSFGYNMIANKELPEYLQVGEQIVGINKKSNNAENILRKTQSLMLDYGGRIYMDEFWMQAKTYVKHQNKANYADSYKPIDKFAFDDILDAATYAFIASLCYQKEPKNLQVEKATNRPQRKMVLRNGSLVYETVKPQIKFIGEHYRNI